MTSGFPGTAIVMVDLLFPHSSNIGARSLFFATAIGGMGALCNGLVLGERLPDGLGEVGDFRSTDDTDGLLRRPITGESLTAPWGTLVKEDS